MARPGSAGPGRAEPDERFRRLRSTGDQRLREELILDYQWVARRCASRLRDRGEPYDDLVQVATLALVKAVDRFDPDHGSSFPSYALPSVSGELRRHFRDHTWRVSVPRRAKDLGPNVNAAIEQLVQRTGRSPRPDEVAAFLEIDVELVLEVLEARSAYRPVSMSASAGLDGEASSLEELLGRADPALADAAERLSVREATRRLEPRRRRVVMWRFYEGLTQSEIGQRLGVGQVQVSRLLRSALAELRLIISEPAEPEPHVLAG